MKPTPERTQAIRDYFAWNFDRAGNHPNPLFAGRDAEMNGVLHHVGLLHRSDGPMPNMTGLIFGAPGAGKSELLVQLKARIQDVDPDNPPIVIQEGADVLLHPSSLAAALYDEVPTPAQHRLRARGWSFDTATMKFGPAELAASGGHVGALKYIARELREANGGSMPTVVLLIDEAQARLAKVAPYPDAQYALAMHLGETGLKVLTVYGGLGNTPDALADCGVTRPNQHMRFLLRRLDDPTSRGIAAEALAAITDQPPRVIGEWAEAIAAHSDGWPAHLSTAIRLVTDRARENDWRLDRDGFNAAMARPHKLRRRYCSDRLWRCKSLDTTQYGRWAAMMRANEEVTAAVVGDALDLDLPGAKALVADAVAAGLLDPRSMDDTFRRSRR